MLKKSGLVLSFIALLIVFGCKNGTDPLSIRDDAFTSDLNGVLSKDCSKTQTGNIPINDLGTGTYQGKQGGLYPGGSNSIPGAHLSLGLSLAAEVQPRDASGNPDPANGKIVLISIGVSNTRNIFSGQTTDGGPVEYSQAFKPRADADPDKNPKLVIVNGAQGSQPISSWLSPNASTWSEVDNRLASAGVTPEQVQAAWVMLPEKNPTEPFPTDALTYKDDLETVLRNLKTNYPNIKLAYLSSRIYGGYGTKPSSPEPWAYQHGFGVKWTIEDQINGVGNINPDPAKGTVVAPWIAWGPYLWADGVNPRSDGLTWVCDDFAPDGVHPAASAVDKAASRLLSQFKTDPTSKNWFTQSGASTQPPVAVAGADQTVLDQDGNGTAQVTLDGSGSYDPDGGSIVSYEWKEGSSVLGTSAKITIDLNVGDHTIVLTVTDDESTTGRDTVMVTVTANQPPVANPQTVSTDEDTPLDLVLTGSDPEGSSLTYSIQTGPVHGQLTGTAPNLTYTPDQNFNGADSLIFRVNDGFIDSAPATVLITINPINDPPVANAQSVTTRENTAIDITLTGSDVEGSALTFAVVTGPAHGSLSGTAPAVTYTPNNGYSGTDSFTFKVNDGTTDSNEATVTITIEANQIPVASALSITTAEDQPVAITLAGTDGDNDPLTFQIQTNPSHGSLSGTAPNLTYTPDANYNGTDSFTFTANDGFADSPPATVSITVTAVNDAPEAYAQSLTVFQGVPLSIKLSATDVEGDVLTYTVVALPAHGTLTGTAPDLTYTSNADYVGTDSFTFKASDGNGDSNIATVTITVVEAPPVDPPTNVRATAGSGYIDVNWDASPTANVTYRVYRSTTAGGPYALIVAGVTGLSYRDENVEAGMTYYYVVTADVDCIESFYSNEASAQAQN